MSGLNKSSESYPQYDNAQLSKPIRLYRPSNGTEGHCFMGEWCANCARDKAMNGEKDFDDCREDELCQIIADSFAFDVDDERYPKQWVYGKDGPECTAFIEQGKPIPPERDTKTIDMFGGVNG